MEEITKDEKGRRFFAVFCGLIFALLIFETVLRIWLPRKLDPYWHAELKNPTRLSDRDVSSITRALDSECHHTHQRAFKREKMTFENYDSILSINSQGIRGKLEDISEKPTKFRIAVLGDSFTFGYMVSDEFTFPAQLEQMLNSRDSTETVEVLNFGVNSYSPLLMLQQYRKKVRKFNPDLVIVAVDNSDLQDDYNYSQEAIFDERGTLLGFDTMVFSQKHLEALMLYDEELTSPSHRLKNLFTSRLHIAALMRDYLKKDNLWNGTIKTDRLGHLREHSDWRGHWNRSSDFLSQLITEIRSDKKAVCLVYYPYPLQVSDHAWKGRTDVGFKMGKMYDTPLREWLKVFSLQHQTAFLDTTEALKAKWSPACSFELDYHYKPAGYKILSESLADFLISQKLLEMKAE
jgi:lysophospholipase L1-like esterase